MQPETPRISRGSAFTIPASETCQTPGSKRPNLYSKRRPAPTLGESKCTVHENFTLETTKTTPDKRGFVSVLKYKGQVIATVSWYKQTRVAAFLIHSGTLLTYDDMQTCLDDLVMHTLHLRLRGEL